MFEKVFSEGLNNVNERLIEDIQNEEDILFLWSILAVDWD